MPQNKKYGGKIVCTVTYQSKIDPFSWGTPLQWLLRDSTEGQITKKSLWHLTRKNLKKKSQEKSVKSQKSQKKNLKISKKVIFLRFKSFKILQNPKTLQKNLKISKTIFKDLNLCHFFPSYLPLGLNRPPLP